MLGAFCPQLRHCIESQGKASPRNPPRPLRSESYPDGLQGLSEREEERVKEANMSYEAMVELLLILISFGIAVSVENPLNSLFWMTSFMVRLFDRYPGHFTILQHCMHGGTRDKKSKFWSHNPRKPEENFLASLGLLCDQSHQHESWKPRWVDGKLFFPTAAEAAYPYVLCQRMASLCLDEAKAREVSPCETLQEQLSLDLGTGKRNLFAAQSRGNKLKQILGEYGSTIQAAVPLGFQNLDKMLKDFPKGTKVVHRQLKWGYMRDDWINKISWTEHIEEGAHFELIKLGVPRCPETFMKEATEAGHPRHALARVSDLMKSTLQEVFLGDPFKIRSKRASFLKKWMKRAVELRADERRKSS